MSISALNWALNVTVESASHKLVLMLLANFADEQGRSWPSQKVIAEKACLSVRSVVTALAELEKGGLITREARWRPGGSRGTDIIRLPVDRENVKNLHVSGNGADISPLTKDAKSVDQTCKSRTTKGANVSPLTTFEPPLEPSKTLSAASAAGGDAAKPDLSVEDECWIEGKANLVRCGMSERDAGSTIGAFLKAGFPHAAVLAASRATLAAKTHDPRAYMAACLRPKDDAVKRRSGERSSAATRFKDRMEARDAKQRAQYGGTEGGPVIDHEGDGRPYGALH